MTATARLRTALAGRYVLVREVGAGGMATVYLADDVRHDRQVAIKVLHPELSAVLGPERFLAEIRTTAKLQHPHILPLFDSGEASGLLYYVMPFVEGETLRARLERERQLPIGDALRIATEAADALQYAHEHGLVHRDVKPENILLQNGHALVADFGIALAVEQAGGVRMTQTGLSLGTPQYMAPEQAMGERNIDARADIYALGAVTYEMLAGEPPFSGPNGQAIIAKVITEDAPSLRAHRRSVPEHVDAAVAHALEKLPADRFATAREMGAALDGAGDVRASTHRRDSRGRRPWRSSARVSPVWLAIGGVVTLGMGGLLGAAWNARHTAITPAAHLSIPIPDDHKLADIVGPPVVFSPDGQAVVYVGLTNADSHTKLYYRPLDRLEATELQGTDDGGVPFFSPDGRDVAFAANHVVKRVSVTGGAATSLLDAGGANFTIAGGAWGPGGNIVIGSDRGLWALPESGGSPKLVTHVDSRHGEIYHAMPRFLPDGETVAFDIDYATGDGDSRVGLVSLRTGKSTVLDVHARNTVGLVDGSLIVGTRGAGSGRLSALPFDVKHWRVTGPAVPVLDQVAFKSNGGAEASLADNGSLVYLNGSAESRLVLLDARGNETAGPGEMRTYSGPSFSPDGHHVAVAIHSDKSGGEWSDIWSYDVASGALSRLTSRVTAMYPSWTPDGHIVAYVGAPGHDFSQLWQVAADGSGAEQLLYTLPEGSGFRWRPTFTPDGATIVEEVQTRQTRVHELWTIQRSADGRWSGKPWLQASADLEDPRLSPDGHWLAYESYETGRFEVYVRPFPGPGGRVQISTNGGKFPLWSRDGHRVYFLPSETGGHLMQAELSFTPSLAVTSRTAAFSVGGSGITIEMGGSYYSGDYDIRPDEKGAVTLRTAGGRQVVVVLNWRDELRRKLAAPGTP